MYIWYDEHGDYNNAVPERAGYTEEEVRPRSINLSTEKVLLISNEKIAYHYRKQQGQVR